jgi:hypothetical protein
MSLVFNYNFKDYHKENACGPDDAIGVTKSYSNRFYCDPKDPPEVNLEKFNKATACFIGRVNEKRKKSTNTAGASNSNRVKSNETHVHPIRLAYAFAKDCARTIFNNTDEFEKSAETFVKASNVQHVKGLSYLIPELRTQRLPFIPSKADPVTFISHVPEICGIKPRSEKEFVTHLSKLPLLNKQDRNKYLFDLKKQQKCLSDKLLTPDHINNKKLKLAFLQINAEIEHITQLGNYMYETRNTAHESNKIRILENYGKKEFGNSTRSATNYYKSMRNTFKKTRKLRS